MTIANTITSVQGLCNGITTAFSYPNKIFEATDLTLTLIANQGTPAEVDSVFTYVGNNQFSQTALGLTATVSNVDVDTGSTVTLSAAPATGYVFDMRSNVAEVQSTSIKNQGQFLPDLHEEFFDRITREAQDLRRLTYSFGIHGPDNEATPWPALPAPQSRLGMSIIFDPIAGLPTVGVPTATVAAITSALINSLLTQAGVGAVLYPPTGAEIAASVTPVNLFYPPMYVDRYATNAVPGMFDMSGAFTAAVKVAQQNGGIVRYGATAPYLLAAPVDCTFTGTANQKGIVIQGSYGNDAGNAILAKHTGVAVFDATGNDSIVLRDVAVRTDATTFPSTCFLTARNSGGGSLYVQLHGCHFIGNFGVACYYDYGSEDDVLEGNYFYNGNPAANTATRIYTANNIAGLVSPFTTIATGVQSCIDHRSIANLDQNTAGTNTTDLIRLEEADGFKSFAEWGNCPGGRSTHYVDQTNGTTNLGEIIAFTAENSGSPPAYNVLFGATSGATPTGWRISAIRSISATRFFACADANTTMDGLTIDHVSELTSKGISIPGTLQGQSRFFTGATLITLGTLASGSWIVGGPKTRWTITSQDGFANDITAANVSGFGTPTGPSIIANFPGATATLAQTSATVAEILTIMKAQGQIST